MRSTRLVSSLISAFSIFLGGVVHANSREFRVEDAVTWKNIVPFSLYTSQAGTVGLYSPSSDYFLVHTRRGDIIEGGNVEELLVYATASLQSRLNHPKSSMPQPVLVSRHLAKGDEDLISDIKWLDQENFGFVARAPEGIRQAYSVNIKTGTKTQITQSGTDVLAFDSAGQTVIYYACTSKDGGEQPLSFVVNAYNDTVAPRYTRKTSVCFGSEPVELYVRRGGGPVARLSPPAIVYPHNQRLWLSPDAKHAVLIGAAETGPGYWADYWSPVARYRYAATSNPAESKGDPLLHTRYLLADLQAGTVAPLLDAPTGMMALNGSPQEAFWRSDSQSVLVTNAFLPLRPKDGAGHGVRARQPAIAEVNIATRAIQVLDWEEARDSTTNPLKEKIVNFEWDGWQDRLAVVRQGRLERDIRRSTYQRSDETWSRAADNPRSTQRPRIELRQQLNERPALHASDPRCGISFALFDPNPQAADISFGHTQVIRWRDANGIDWTGGLLLPPNSKPETRYPLIVQTHGFLETHFLLEGPTYDGQGSTGMSAQALAAQGFAVLQIEDNRKTITEDSREGPLTAEGFRAGIQAVILGGNVDPARIGLIAFSRTGWGALNLVAQDPSLIQALVMSDTLNLGYMPLSYNVSNPAMVDEVSQLMGGAPKLDHLGDWFARNPLYALPKAHIATRLEGRETGAGMWETFSLLKSERRPVEFVVYPDGSHVLKKPAERLSSMAGSIDWMRFWLKGEEDPAPLKAEQYRRWRALRAETCQSPSARVVWCASSGRQAEGNSLAF